MRQLVVLIFLLLLPAAAALQITEIMYDPIQKEDYNEWIELYNDGSEDVDLSAWTICDVEILPGYVGLDESVHNDQGLVLKPGRFALVTDGGSGTEVYDNFDCSGLAVHINAASICKRLSNDGETITLNNIELSYSADAEEGQSLQLVDGKWISAEPTPGEANSPEGDEQNESGAVDGNTGPSESNNQSESAPEEPEDDSEEEVSETPPIDSEPAQRTVYIENSTRVEELEQKITELESKLQQPEQITTKVVYESKTQRSANLPALLVLGVSILLNVFLIIYTLKKG